jgi:hypothetical protein
MAGLAGIVGRRRVMWLIWREQWVDGGRCDWLGGKSRHTAGDVAGFGGNCRQTAGDVADLAGTVYFVHEKLGRTHNLPRTVHKLQSNLEK